MIGRSRFRTAAVSWLALFFGVVLAGCGGSENHTSAVSGVAANESPSTDAPLNPSVENSAEGLSRLTMQRWSASCALCHVSGVAGAPVTGDAQAWAARLEKGLPQLLTHTIEGFNKMPPLGYCMSCEATDFVAMIEFMAALEQGALAGELSE